MLWYNGDIKNPVSQAERLSVISEGRKRDEEIRLRNDALARA